MSKVESKAVQKNVSKNGFMKKTMKFIAWTTFAILLLMCGLLQATVSVMTPKRITPLTEKYLSQMLNADVTVKRVELTVWETFPDVTLEIDSLAIVSKALDGLNDSVRAKLPANADSLVSLKYFHGGLKLYELLSGNLSLYDIQLHEPMVNLVSVDSTLANYDIMPASDPDTIVEDTAAMEFPKIEIDRFLLIDAKPIRYFSLCDSIDVAMTIKNVLLEGEENPKYEIDFKGSLLTPLLEIINQKSTQIAVDGGIEWDYNNPTTVKLTDFAFGVDIINAKVNTEMDFGDEMVVNSLKLSVDALKYNDLVTRVPKEYASMLDGIKTNATFVADMELTKPFSLTNDSIPHAVVNVSMPQCYFNYDKLKLDKLSAQVNVNLNGNDLNDAVIDIKKIAMQGLGMNCEASTKVSSIMSDPLANGRFKGNLTLDNLPKFITKEIGGAISGVMTADTDFRLRQSELSAKGFHNVKIKGGVNLNNFKFDSSDSLTNVYVRNAEFKLGTSESFVRNSHKIDSLLTASIKIDTCALFQDGYDLRLSNLRAGVGCANLASSLDSTQVNPMAGTIKVGRMNFFSQEDSMKVRLRDAMVFATLRRFQGKGNVPQLALKIDAGRLGAATKEMRVSLNNSSIKVNAHLKPREKMLPVVKKVYDRIRKENPSISSDSAYVRARQELREKMRNMRAKNASREQEVSTIDFGVDRSTRALLNRWDVKGSIKSNRARLFTPYFPLRNTLSEVDIDFTTDSVAFNSVQYKAGRSNFNITGTITNIKKALSGRSNQQLKMVFLMRSDTIDVNQLSEAVFAGAAYGEGATTIDMSATENEELLENTIANQTDTMASAALLVPMNLDVLLRVTAKNVIYGDMLMKRLSGNVQVYRGALRFDQLRATADMGSVNLSALYSAPTKKDMNFGFGLQLKNLYIDKVLDLVPAVDSIMPLMRDIKGIINADIAATADVDTAMNLVIPTLNAAIKLEGDSLVLMDAETFKTIAKWMLFKDKGKNMIDKMSVEVLVKDSQMELFPFMFNIDRYKLGVLGYNDMAMNFNYHVSILDSPIPFKFGVTVHGDVDNMKVKLGRAKFRENMAAERVAIVDTTRVNLLRQIENVFRRGIDQSSKLKLLDTNQRVERFNDEEKGDTISKADSLLFIKEGLIAAPVVEAQEETTKSKKSKK